MSKVITSPVERWAGTVTISDPLTLTQARLIEAGMKQPEVAEGDRVFLSVIDEAQVPAVLGCVEKWELKDFTPDPFPASPRGDSHKLVDWLFREIFKVYIGEAEIPNE